MSVYGTDKKCPMCGGILAKARVNSPYLICIKNMHHGPQITRGSRALTVEEFVKKYNLEVEV